MSVNHTIENLRHTRDYLVFSSNHYFRQPKRFKSLNESQAKQLFAPENIQYVLRAFDIEGNKLLHNAKREMKQKRHDKDLNIEEWLGKHDLPIELADFPEFLNFVRVTHLANVMHYFGDTVEFKNGQPAILVNDQLVSAEEILATFAVNVVDGDLRIVHRETGKVWSYFRNGLTEYNPMQEFGVLDILPLEQRPEKPQLELSFIKEGHTNSAGGLKKYDRHASVKLVHPNGSVISFGRLGRGMSCPDPHEFLPFKRKTITYTITEENFEEILTLAKEKQANRQTYNLLDDNCGTFVSEVVNAVIKDPQFGITGRTQLKEQNTLQHRVKAFAYSEEIAKDLKEGNTTEKLKAFQVNLPHLIDVKLMKAINQSTDIDFNTKMLLNALLLNPAIRGTVDYQLTELIKEIEESTEEDLTEKVYNLFYDIYNANQETVVDHPSLLYTRLNTHS